MRVKLNNNHNVAFARKLLHKQRQEDGGGSAARAAPAGGRANVVLGLAVVKQRKEEQLFLDGSKKKKNADHIISQRRMAITAKIISLFESRTKNPSVEFKAKTPQIAKRLEECLYNSAPSLKVYCDENTLHTRIKQTISHIKNERDTKRKRTSTWSRSTTRTSTNNTTSNSSTPPNTNANDIGTVILAKPSNENQISSSSSSNNNNRNDEEYYKQIQQHKQQRLLLLRHAASCQAKEGECKITPHCTQMKELWKHLLVCKKKKDCNVQYCLSSRFILSHYRKCHTAADTYCQICTPIRRGRIRTLDPCCMHDTDL